MIAVISAVIYLLGVLLSVFVFIPYMIANETIMPNDTEDAVIKAVIWPFHLAYLLVISIIVLFVAGIYMPFDFLFAKSVKWFTNRKKKSNEDTTTLS